MATRKLINKDNSHIFDENDEIYDEMSDLKSSEIVSYISSDDSTISNNSDYDSGMIQIILKVNLIVFVIGCS